MKKVVVVRNFAAIALLLGFLIALPAARADQANQATEVTFSRPVQIPGRILPAGTYWFILPENSAEHDRVYIYSYDRTTSYGVFLTVGAGCVQSTDDTTFTFTESNSAQPQAIVTWFYPDRSDGHEFLYSKQTQKELAKVKQVTVVAGD